MRTQQKSREAPLFPAGCSPLERSVKVFTIATVFWLKHTCDQYLFFLFRRRYKISNVLPFKSLGQLKPIPFFPAVDWRQRWVWDSIHRTAFLGGLEMLTSASVAQFRRDLLFEPIHSFHVRIITWPNVMVWRLHVCFTPVHPVWRSEVEQDGLPSKIGSLGTIATQSLRTSEMCLGWRCQLGPLAGRPRMGLCSPYFVTVCSIKWLKV